MIDTSVLIVISVISALVFLPLAILLLIDFRGVSQKAHQGYARQEPVTRLLPVQSAPEEAPTAKREFVPMSDMNRLLEDLRVEISEWDITTQIEKGSKA